MTTSSTSAAADSREPSLVADRTRILFDPGASGTSGCTQKGGSGTAPQTGCIRYVFYIGSSAGANTAASRRAGRW